MRRLVTALILLLLAATPLAQGEGPADETRETLRHEILRLINRDRAANGLRPVALDLDASVLADAYCRRQIRNRTTGHFTTDGQAPYMRYSFAGGNDGTPDRALVRFVVRAAPGTTVTVTVRHDRAGRCSAEHALG